jgi:RNA polymerase sigma-70 factor, ECF subfamily
VKFEELYERYWQGIYRLCMGYVNSPDIAKDMAQETFITVWEKLPQFRNESAVSTWIYRIAVNKCLRQIEKDKRYPTTEMPKEMVINQPESTDAKVNFLCSCIAELPETERLIISLELENVKQAEIAEIIGISESNVRVKIHRIKEKLTQKFKSYEHE